MDDKKYTFEKIEERDIDMLLMEEFGNNPGFLKFVVSKSKEFASGEIKVDNPRILEIIHSDNDPAEGESDVVVIFENAGIRYGLLIEDKINAVAQTRQASRYITRAENAVKRGDFEKYCVFIVAPEKYINDKNANAEVHKYPNKLTYQEILEFGNINHFHMRQIERAIHKQKVGYTQVTDYAKTRGWGYYKCYRDNHYTDLLLHDFKSTQGPRATWIKFDTWIKNVYINHKTNPSNLSQGSVELTFTMDQDKISELEKFLEEQIDDFDSLGYELKRCGDTQVTLGKKVPLLDLNALDIYDPDNGLLDVLDECLRTIRNLNNEIVKKLKPSETSKKLLEWKKKK